MSNFFTPVTKLQRCIAKFRANQILSKKVSSMRKIQNVRSDHDLLICVTIEKVKNTMTGSSGFPKINFRSYQGKIFLCLGLIKRHWAIINCTYWWHRYNRIVICGGFFHHQSVRFRFGLENSCSHIISAKKNSNKIEKILGYYCK